MSGSGGGPGGGWFGGRGRTRPSLRIGLFLSLFSVPSFAAYEDLGVGARAPGMGDAFVAVADDVYALYYNPAGLGALERPQFGTAYSKLNVGLTDKSDLASSYVGYAHPIRGGNRGSVGLSWNSFALGSLYREQAFGVSYGRRIGEPSRGLHAGATLKYLRSGLGDFPEASNAYSGIALTGRADPALQKRTQGAIDADVGLLWRLGRRYALGLQIMHANQPNVAFQPGASDRLPSLVKAGLAYRSLLSNLVAQVDSGRAPSGAQDARLVVGAERWFSKLLIGEFALRGGLGFGTRERREVTAGLSYKARRLGVDYGFGIPLGGLASTAGTHRVAVNFKFGTATEEDESLEMVLEAMRQLRRGEAAPRFKVEGTGLSIEQRTTLEEFLAQARAAQARAQYKDGLAKLAQAVSLAPGDKALLAEYGRLNYVAQQIPALPQYKSDPIQAAMHQGLLAYLGGKDRQAVAKLAEALRLSPDYRELEVFLAGLERVTGEKRPAAAPRPRNWRHAEALTKSDTAIQEGRYRDAIELALEVLREEEKNSLAWQHLGTSYFALKDYQRSLSSWQRALELESDAEVRREIRGYLRSVEKAVRQGEARRAAPAAAPAPPIRPAVEVSTAPAPPLKPRLSPQEVQRLFDRAVDFYTRRKLSDAKALLERILEAEPDNGEARKALRRVEEELK